MQYEILSKEQVEKMSDREIELSLSYYSYNFDILNQEIICRDENDYKNHFAEIDVPSATLESSQVQPKNRGRKKKQQ